MTDQRDHYSLSLKVKLDGHNVQVCPWLQTNAKNCKSCQFLPWGNQKERKQRFPWKLHRFAQLEGGQTDIKKGPHGNDEFNENDEHFDSLKSSLS